MPLMFDDPDLSKVDMSVVASLPIAIRMEVEHELAKQRRQQQQQQQLDNNKKKKKKKPGGGSGKVEEGDDAKIGKKRKKYWQAKETKDGEVEVLCFECRRQPQKKRQQTLLNFATITKSKSLRKENNSADKEHEEEEEKPSSNDGNSNNVFCACCRIPLQKTKKNDGNSNITARKVVSILPQMTRLKGYKRLAMDTGVPFALTDSEAMTIMRQPCFGCGKAAGDDGNGISRLRNWTGFSEETKKSARKGFMGPFSTINCISACSVCNLMKGYRSVAPFVEACRTIATHGTNKDYGRYPNRFRDNISKRSRSCYITKSSTHTKTHCLTNQQFNDIVSMPCAYCGKQPSSTHHNGLDRLDSDNRVYSTDNVVSCCGDCNIMKYKHSVDFFIQHCARVADHHLEVVFDDDNDTHFSSETDTFSDDKNNSNALNAAESPKQGG